MELEDMQPSTAEVCSKPASSTGLEPVFGMLMAVYEQAPTVASLSALYFHLGLFALSSAKAEQSAATAGQIGVSRLCREKSRALLVVFSAC